MAEPQLGTDYVPSGKPFTGWHMLGVVFLFFGVIIAVNIFMAFKAISTWTGLEVENSYVASQEFNTKLAASRAQHALNWNVNLHYADGHLNFALTDEDGNALHPDNVTVALTRPVGVHEDRTLVLTEDGDFYRAEDVVPEGVWNALINADVEGYPSFEYRARLFVAH
ncbi:MAG: FixH family protein [Hyphomicrobiaceae bacterium]|nr:FixH family protein [Hyphomicrobiaceae bacterium]MCC0022760.1 FixH family protein [Hyphomicrobiaceae bacterium]